MPVSHARAAVVTSTDGKEAGEVPGLLEVLAQVPDPRKRRGRRYVLVFVLAVAVACVLAGAKSFREIGDQAADLPPEILARLGGKPHPLLRRTIAPSEKRVRTLIHAIGAEILDELIGGWLRALADAGRQGGLLTAIAIDGKWLRGVADGQVKLFAAMLHENKAVIAQHRIPDETTETTQLKELLEPVDLEGAVVTADAAHAQRETADCIAGKKEDGNRGSDYFLFVRGNQPSLHKAIFDAVQHDGPREPDHTELDYGLRRRTTTCRDARRPATSTACIERHVRHLVIFRSSKAGGAVSITVARPRVLPGRNSSRTAGPLEETDGMSFFEDTPMRPRPRRRPMSEWALPDGVIPGVIHIGLILIRTDELAVAVNSVAAYPNGFEFTVHALLHHEQLAWGISPIDPSADAVTKQYPEQALRLGIQYADGRRARSNNYQPMPVDDTDGEDLLMTETGSGGTGRQWGGRFWVHPLPSDGPVTFIASWLLRGVTEVSAALDSSVIHEAAGRAVILWPDEP